MTDKKANLAVYIGRYSPFHRGHLSVIETGLENADFLTILIGPAFHARTTFAPFTFDERREMILGSIPKDFHDRILIQPLVDWTYNDDRWILGVQERAKEALVHFGLDDISTVTLLGCSKDSSSYYLKMFPQWKNINAKDYRGLSATPIREAYFSQSNETFLKLVEQDVMPDGTLTVLDRFSKTKVYSDLVEEFSFYDDYKKDYSHLKWKPTFVTVDACVVQSGHVLLIQRRARPGKNLWALPGGFVNNDETVENAVFRELFEETKIKVPEKILRGSVKKWDKYDSPHRSARGRTITFAYLIHLPDDVLLPKVRGSDDAKNARWWPLSDVKSDMLFEDHFAIMGDFTFSIG